MADLVPWPGIDHHADCAKLSEALLRGHSKAIGQRCDLGGGSAGGGPSVLDILSARQGIRERWHGSYDILGRNVDCGARLGGGADTVFLHLTRCAGGGEGAEEPEKAAFERMMK